MSDDVYWCVKVSGPGETVMWAMDRKADMSGTGRSARQRFLIREDAVKVAKWFRADEMPATLVKVTARSKAEVRARDQKHRYFGFYRGFRDASIEVGLVPVPESTVDYYLHVMVRLDEKTFEAAAKAGVTHNGRPASPRQGDGHEKGNGT